MRIETQIRKTRAARTPRRRGLKLALGGAALLAYSALLFAGGIAFLDYVRPSLLNLTGTTSSRQALGALLQGPRNYASALLAREPVETLHLDIRFRDLARIREKRDEALRLGILMASPDDLVPATIRHGERSIPVRLRLKGDYLDHLEGEKWSFRVQTRRGDQILGMRRFSLQAPRTRGFHAEAVVLDHMRREGVLAPRYFFVDVSVNGRGVGLMALEEHFSKELLESQQRREGVIARFDEDPFFEQKILSGTHGPYDNLLVATIRPFQDAKIAESEALSAQLDAATGLLRGFLAGELPAREVFDVDLYGRFFAVAELWRSLHVLRWHNLRFYFNPITQRIEPVAFDVNLQASYLGPGLVSLSEQFSQRALGDADVRAAFVHHLGRLVGEAADGSLARWLAQRERPLLAALHREFPFRSALDLAPLIARGQRLREIDLANFEHFEPWAAGPRGVYARPVIAYLVRDDGGSRLELANALPVPVRVSEIRVTGLPDGIAAPPLAPQAVELPPTPPGGAPRIVRLAFEPPAAAFGVEAVAQVDGQPRAYRVVAEPYAAVRRANPIPRATRAEVLTRHGFLEWNEAERSFRAAPGVHRVAGSLVLSEGDGLVLPAGTVLRFDEGEALIATGPLSFRGTPEAPVVLEPAPGASSWSGVCVLHADRPYAWRHARVRGTAGIERGSWRLTGGVTLRASDVTLASVEFVGNRTEDALNLVRSRFEMSDVRISDTPSDAFDADFSNGTVRGGRIAQIGGDGVDVSGADVVVEGTRLEEIRDKAISVGEGSRLVARGVHIARVGTGVASKDRSEASIEASRISDVVHVALMAYVKKPEYGPAAIRARDVVLERVTREAVAQIGSRVSIDGREITPEAVDVDELYRGGYMQK